MTEQEKSAYDNFFDILIDNSNKEVKFINNCTPEFTGYKARTLEWKFGKVRKIVLDVFHTNYFENGDTGSELLNKHDRFSNYFPFLSLKVYHPQNESKTKELESIYDKQMRTLFEIYHKNQSIK